MSFSSVEERREYHRKYYKKWNIENKDKLSLYSKKYRTSKKGKSTIRKRDLETSFGKKLRLRYKLTTEKYNQMLLDQFGVCACCGKEESFIHNKTGKPRRLVVDHCHISGKIRGLLCTSCNLLLGNAKDSTDILISAINYLEKYK